MTGHSIQQALYPISVEGKWGFINAAGQTVIQPQFLEVGRFSEGLARVSVPGLTEEDRFFERNASGFIDATGTFVIGPGPPVNFELPADRRSYAYGDFHERLATFWVGDSTGFGGYIDQLGKLAIPPEFSFMHDFSDGLASVRLRATYSNSSGFIDHNGEFAFSLEDKSIASVFADSRCVVHHLEGNRDWAFSVINKVGETVIPRGLYSTINQYAGGLSVVRRKDKWGCIDINGRLVISLEFDRLREFEPGKLATGAIARTSFIVNRQGECVKELALSPEVDIGRLCSGLATVRVDNNVGYIDAAGELVIPVQFDRAEDFHGDLALVKQGKQEGYINKRGEFVWQTDCWDEPLHNRVEGLLAGFLPPHTKEALPLDYNWGRVDNAIVFASDSSLEAIEGWLDRTFGEQFKVEFDNSTPGQLGVDFRSEKWIEVYAVDVHRGDFESFLSFYASENAKLLLDKHQPRVLGILIENR